VCAAATEAAVGSLNQHASRRQDFGTNSPNN